MKSNEIQSRKVAVTGSTGMVGSNLVAELIKSGCKEIVLPVRNAKRIENIHRACDALGVSPKDASLNVIEMELTDTDKLTEVFNSVEIVFHCAGIIMTGQLDEKGLINNNQSLARSVADAAIAAGVKRVVHTSSIAVLCPEGNGHFVTEEGYKPFADESCSAYAQSKFYADNEMRRIQEAGIELVILYPAVVIGEGNWSLNGSSAMIPIISMWQPFYADGVMAYVDVRDLARSYVYLATIPEADGESFIVSGANITYRELINMGAEITGHGKPFIRVGKVSIYTAYLGVKVLVALRIMKNRSIKKNNLASVLYGNKYCGSKLEKFCNFEYTPIEDTLRRVISAYKRDKKERRTSHI